MVNSSCMRAPYLCAERKSLWGNAPMCLMRWIKQRKRNEATLYSTMLSEAVLK